MPPESERWPHRRPPPRRRIGRAAVHLLVACSFAWVFHVRYWAWRDCIAAAASSCVTDDGDNLTSGGAFWAIPAIGFAVAAIASLRRR
jgi:hypothetical protein